MMFRAIQPPPTELPAAFSLPIPAPLIYSNITITIFGPNAKVIIRGLGAQIRYKAEMSLSVSHSPQLILLCPLSTRDHAPLLLSLQFISPLPDMNYDTPLYRLLYSDNETPCTHNKDGS